MTRSAGRRATFLALIVLAALWAGPAAPSAAAQGWRLDLDKAMDAIGLTSGMVVGEAGAGEGYFTIPMARRVGPTGVVCANDISARALEQLAHRSEGEHLSNIRTVVGEVADPRFPRRDLQLVVIVHAFHDFSQPVEWLSNLKAYLRPGASVAIIDEDPAQGAPSHFLRRERIVERAAEAGYELMKTADLPTAHLVLVFRPKAA